MTGPQARGVEETADFAGLTILYDQRVLRPRPWTAAQSHWAATLLKDLPPGPVLELCAGAGQIGLGAVATSRRRLVCVDLDPVATQYAATNAEAAGMADRVETRAAVMTEALSPDETFALVIADPPWVRRVHTGRFPEDPLTAIDGGPDGLEGARDCLAVMAAHVVPQGCGLLQLGTTTQLHALSPEIQSAGLLTTEVRSYEGGVVALLQRPGR